MTCVFAASVSHSRRDATDSGDWCPLRGIGTAASTIATDSGVDRSWVVIGVSTVPGATALSGTPRPAHAVVTHSRRTQRDSARLDDG
ncbi:Uncharacterised protein [Mycobacteroides abscessus]|nr:Uncharacterised protein [Mycobacteroides abscessus]